MQISAEITINAPTKKVFEVFSDIEKAGERIKGIDKIEILSDEKTGMGLKWRETRTMMGKEATEVMWVTDFQSPQKYVVEAESRGTHYVSTYTFTEVDGGTHVGLTFDGQPLTLGSRILGVLFSFMKGSMTKMLVADMNDLKNFIEN